MVTVKLKHPKCPICAGAMLQEGASNFICYPCNIVVFMQIVGIPDKDEKITLTGGLK